MSKAALPQVTLEKWGAEHFGTALSVAVEDLDGEIIPSRPTGKRQAKARRKGQSTSDKGGDNDGGNSFNACNKLFGSGCCLRDFD